MMSFRNFTKIAPRGLATRRPMHTTSVNRAYKDSQDRSSLDPRPIENTASGRDTDVAATDAAFDPTKTRPESQADTSDPQDALQASGANQDLSKPRGDENAPQEKAQETQKGGKSKGFSSEKKGTPEA